ncbi:hypothetical protein [Marinoscillum sp.]|uniref:hypothetical protein n=1 Tax=Marinoscillum sp. TaxID=2024838 RepID=UPI003BABA1D5
MKVFGYIGFVVLFFLTLYGVHHFIDGSQPATITSEVVEPDILLSNTKKYFQQDSHERSMEHLMKAIRSIERIEQDIDDSSKLKVDKAVNDLKLIYAEMRHDTFNIKKLNEASVKALNALTYAELKVTEHFVESHHLDKARVALNYGIMHIKNALMFSEGSKKDYEVQLYTELDSLIEHGHYTDKQLIQQLETMIDNLDDVRITNMD